MAKYQHLPIYTKAFELVVYLESTVRNFSRYHKYTIGTRLREASWEVVTLIVKANNTPVAERRDLLVSLRDKIEEINIGLNVAKELQAFNNFNSYNHAAKLAVNLGRQSEGWLKSSKSSKRKPAPESLPRAPC